MTRDATEARAAFAERCAITRTDLHRRIEQAVIGSNFGANGYATLDQANRLAELLQLDANRPFAEGSMIAAAPCGARRR